MACIEPITFNADGTINEVEMTSQGAAPPLDAFARTDAFRACLMHGAAIKTPPLPSPKGEGEEAPHQPSPKGERVTLAVDSPFPFGEAPGGTSPWALWRYLDFGRGARRLTLSVKAHAEGKIVVLADSLNGRCLGEVSVQAQDGWQEVSMRIRKIRGVHALYLKFEPAATAWAHLMQRTAPSPYVEDRGGAPGESAVWLHLNWFLFGKM